MTNLPDLYEQENKVNPFTLLGVESWILKGMEIGELKRFLGDLKRILAKYYHPDITKDTPGASTKTTYFTRVCSEIDTLLSDDFYFRSSLQDFRSDQPIQRQRRALRVEREKSGSLEKELNELRTTIKQKEEDYLRRGEDREDLIRRLKRNETDLINLGGGILLSPDETWKMRYGEILLQEFKVLLEIVGKINSDPIELERWARGAMEEVVREGHLFEVDVRGRDFATTYHPGKKKELKKDSEILGTIPYSAIREFIKCYGNKIPSPQGGVIPPYYRNFNFNPRTDPESQKLLQAIAPFLSNCTFPLTPQFVVEKSTYRGKEDPSYRLILPVEISR